MSRPKGSRLALDCVTNFMSSAAPPPNRVSIVRAALAVEGGIAAAAAVLARGLELPLADIFAIGFRSVGQGVAGCLPLAALMLAITYIPLVRFKRFNRQIEHEIVPLFRDCRWHELALISALAGFGEEWLFRGLLQRGLAPHFGPTGACLASAALFGLAHAVSTPYALLTAVIGLYLGWLWQATDNLLPPMLAHGLYDFIALIFLTRVRYPKKS